MQNFLIVLFNLLLLAFALTTGVFLLIGVVTVIAGIVGYVLIRQKLTGKLPFVQRYQAPSEEPAQDTQVIEAEYCDITPPDSK